MYSPSPTLPQEWFYENIRYIQGYLTVTASDTETPHKTPHQFITWLRNTYKRSQSPTTRGRSEETLKALRTDLLQNLKAGSCTKEVFDFIDRQPLIVGLDVIQYCNDKRKNAFDTTLIQNLN